jgi:hypothetical protein
MVQPYGIVENVLIEFQDSLTLVDFMVVDMDPHQETSIILGNPFLKSVRATIDKTSSKNVRAKSVWSTFTKLRKTNFLLFLSKGKHRCIPLHLRFFALQLSLSY